MKIKVSYYIPIEEEIEMTPEEYCLFHADGKLYGKKIIPDKAIYPEVQVGIEAQMELDNFFFKKK